MLAAGSQILLTTHWPILAGLPGAQPHQIGERGIIPVACDSSDLATSWRHFPTDQRGADAVRGTRCRPALRSAA
jgi:predicted ATPase